MEVKNNPAGRLHDLLEMARHRPGNDSSRKAWAAVFDVSAEDTAAILKMLADLIDLTHETKIAIQRLDDVDHGIYLEPFKRIEALLSQINLDASWDHWQKQLDSQTLYGLKFGADKLSRLSGYTQIEKDEITALRVELESMLASVIDTDLPQPLKELFLRNLEALRHALLAYRIRGIEGLQQEIERAVGSLVLHKEQIPPAGSDARERKTWEGFFSLVDRLNKLVSLARNAKALSGSILPAITQLFDK